LKADRTKSESTELDPAAILFDAEGTAPVWPLTDECSGAGEAASRDVTFWITAAEEMGMHGRNAIVHSLRAYSVCSNSENLEKEAQPAPLRL
jgi:hypothetical protein